MRTTNAIERIAAEGRTAQTDTSVEIDRRRSGQAVDIRLVRQSRVSQSGVHKRDERLRRILDKVALVEILEPVVDQVRRPGTRADQRASAEIAGAESVRNACDRQRTRLSSM